MVDTLGGGSDEIFSPFFSVPSWSEEAGAVVFTIKTVTTLEREEVERICHEKDEAIRMLMEERDRYQAEREKLRMLCREAYEALSRRRRK